MRKHFGKSFSLYWLTVGVFFTLALFGAERPNIVFVYTDDQAPWAVGISGNSQIRTPHMDRLFREGAYLVNAFTTTPVCSPSRAGLMTSRYGSELGITEWINPRRELQLGLDPATRTFPEVLAENGYINGLVGKWHLGLPDRYHPTKTGFHYFMGFRGGGTRPKDPTLEKDGETREFAGFTPDILTDHALEFIREHREHTFFLALHFRAPHARWLPVADEDWAPYEDLEPQIPNPDYPKLGVERVKRMTREYMASVSSVDRNLGRVLALLDELKLRDETAVIFTSDHGYNMGHHGIWHKGNGHWVLTQPPPASKNIPKNQRPNMYEHSIRVPTAVRWPGMIRPGTIMKRTVTNLDWYPTILAMAGVKPPAGTTLRGRNFLPLLKGEEIPWNDDLFAEYSTHHQTHTHMRMFRTSHWKIIRDFLNPGRDELYDLQSDPDERRNLIFDGRAEVRAAILALDEKMLAQMEKIGDPLSSSRERREKRD